MQTMRISSCSHRIVEEQIDEMQEDSFHCFVSKNMHLLIAKIQACFWKRVENFLGAKFQITLQ